MKLFYFLPLITISGCGLMTPAPKKMYDGDQRPLSVLSVIAEGDRASFRVVSVDGENILFLNEGAPPTKGIHVLPGTHIVMLLVHRTQNFMSIFKMQNNRAEVKITTEAGHSYAPRFKSNQVEGNFHFWIEDKGVNYPQECLTQENYIKMYIKNGEVKGC